MEVGGRGELPRNGAVEFLVLLPTRPATTGGPVHRSNNRPEDLDKKTKRKMDESKGTKHPQKLFSVRLEKESVGIPC